MVSMRVIYVLVTVCLFSLYALPFQTEDSHYVNRFLVQLHDSDAAERVARDLGFEIEDDLSDLGYVVLKHHEVSHRSRRSAEDYVRKLKDDSRVKFANQEKTLIRVKREIIHDKQNEFEIKKILDNSIYYREPSANLMRRGGYPSPTMEFNDPFYKDEWYCSNDGQTGGSIDVDLNVVIAWMNGYTGAGVNICLLDDGIDHTHDDIKDNYRPDISTDLNDRGDNDPMPDVSNSDNSHGTRCAGEIVAKANNGICGVGIAFNASIGGIRILDGAVTDSLEAIALTFKLQIVHLYSASWGPRDDGRTLEGPGAATVKAIKRGVKEGRNNLGNIYVWASGNGGGNDDDCNCDGYVSMRETISIGSITDTGKTPYFMERCTSTMSVVPSGGEEFVGQDDKRGKPKIRVVTTDLGNGCIENFEGTSAAAPQAAACISLAMCANQNLTWRDVQHIVAKGSRIPSVTDDWVVNGGGYHRSHSFGFGVMDCSLMVELALTWKTVPEQKECSTKMFYVNKQVPSNDCVTEYVDMSDCHNDPGTHIEQIEHTELHVEIEAQTRGQVSVTLTSAAGTVSEMLSTRKLDKSRDGIKFKFMSLNNWGENVVGEHKWKIEVCDNDKSGHNKVKFNKYQMTVTGTSDSPNKRSTKSFQPSTAAVEEMKNLELKRGRRLQMKSLGEPNKDDGVVKEDKEETIEEKEQQKYLKDVIKDVSSYLQQKGFGEDHIIDILNHGMAQSSKVSNGFHESSRGVISRRKFGEEEIDHDQFINGMSRAVGNILKEREMEKERRERQKQAMEEKSKMEDLKEKIELIERRKEEAQQENMRKIMEEKRRREKEEKKEEETQEERKLELAEQYIERSLQVEENPSDREVERILQNVRRILQNRK